MFSPEGLRLDRAGRGASKKIVRRGSLSLGERMLVVKLVFPVATTVMGPGIRPSRCEKVVR